MHPTANSVAFILNHLARRVMPGVRSAESSVLPTQELQPAALSRSNNGMQRSADT
jgi:hypothetical protein